MVEESSILVDTYAVLGLGTGLVDTYVARTRAAELKLTTSVRQYAVPG